MRYLKKCCKGHLQTRVLTDSQNVSYEWSINESQTLIEKDTSESEHGNGKVKSESGANSFLIGWEIIFFNELLLQADFRLIFSSFGRTSVEVSQEKATQLVQKHLGTFLCIE